MPKTVRKSTKGGQVVKEEWLEATPQSVIEIEPDVLLVGVNDVWWDRYGLVRIDWKDKSVNPINAAEDAIQHLARSPDGSIWAVAWFGVYQFKSQGN